MRRNRRRPRRGVFIMNMLVTLGLMAGFVIVAERLFRLTVMTVSKSTAGQEDALRLERALDVLRADVWGAAKVEPGANGSTVRVTDAGQATVEWRTEGDGGDVVRVAGAEERRWPELRLAFRAEGGLLTVTRGGRDVAVLRRAGGAR